MKNETLNREVWRCYATLFCDTKDLLVLLSMNRMLDHLVQEKDIDLLSEIPEKNRNLFINQLTEKLEEKKPTRQFHQLDNKDKLKNILLICINKKLNELLAFLLRIGAANCYAGADSLEENYHPLYVCNQRHNLEALKIFLLYAPFVYYIHLPAFGNFWFLVSHSFLLKEQLSAIQAIYTIKPELLDSKDSYGSSLAHYVFEILQGDTQLPVLFKLIFGLRPQLFTQKNYFNETPWQVQARQHPEQTPQKLLGEDCYTNPAYLPYLPEQKTVSLAEPRVWAAPPPRRRSVDQTCQFPTCAIL